MAVELGEARKINYVNNVSTEKKKTPLKQLVYGEKGIIIDTPHDPFLASLGFRAGKTVSIIAKEIFDGPLVCSVDGRNIAVGQDLADKIIVRM